MSNTVETSTQNTETKDLYGPLNVSRNEIRLISFEKTTEFGPMSLTLHCVSLDDWKDEYKSFRAQKMSTTNRSQLAEAWPTRLKGTTDPLKDNFYDLATRFTWGDYICLSYTRGGGGVGGCTEEETTVLLDGIAKTVNKHLVAALQDLEKTPECRVGMKFWVDALCINQADIVDQSVNLLRVKDIFGRAFSVVAWTKTREDLGISGLSQPGESLLTCQLVLIDYGKQTLSELLGARNRDWEAAEDEDERLMRLVQDVEHLVFDQFHSADSDDEDGFIFQKPHLRDMALLELWYLLQKPYWSEPFVIQELAESPTTSRVYWGESSIFDLSTILVVGEIILEYFKSERQTYSPIWPELKPKLDLLALISAWGALKTTPSDS